MTRRNYWTGMAALAVFFLFFVIPFLFIFLIAVKSPSEASRLAFSLPKEWFFWHNLTEVVKTRNYMLLLAYFNSTVITVGAMTLLVICAAMIGYILQRRNTRWNRFIYAVILAGLMIPPAVVPTIWLLQKLFIFKTLHSMILIQVAYGLSFAVLLFRAFIATIPRDLDEAAIVDGAKPWQIFFRVVLPLLKPVTITIILVQSVTIFNDFTNPLYYLPGRDNVTVLFMNILLVTIPPLIVFIFFNRQIIAGMTAGAVKG